MYNINSKLHVLTTLVTCSVRRGTMFDTRNCDGPENPFLRVLGQPSSNYPRSILGGDGVRDIFTLPVAYDNRAAYLGLTIETMIVDPLIDFMYRVLPPILIDAIEFTWNVWNFQPTPYDLQTELTASRNISSSRESFQAYTQRYGQAAHFENGYLATPEGQLHYRTTLIHLVRNLKLTITIDQLYTLFNARNKYARVQLGNNGPCRTISDVFAIGINRWAKLQKNTDGNGWSDIDRFYTSAIEREAQRTPSVYIVPPNITSSYRMGKIDYQRDGPIAIANLNQPVPFQGIQGTFPPEATSGAKVVFAITEWSFNFVDLPADITRRCRQIGDYATSSVDMSCIDPSAYRSCLSDVKIFSMDMTNGQFVTLSQRTLILNCNRFKEGTGELADFHRQLVEDELLNNPSDMNALDSETRFIDMMLYFDRKSVNRSNELEGNSSGYHLVEMFGEMETAALSADAVRLHAASAVSRVRDNVEDSELMLFRSGLDVMNMCYDFVIDQATANWLIANTVANLGGAQLITGYPARITPGNEFGCDDLIEDCPGSFNGYPRGYGSYPGMFTIDKLARQTVPGAGAKGVSAEVLGRVKGWALAARKVLALMQGYYPRSAAFDTKYCPQWFRTERTAQNAINTACAGVMDYSKHPIWVRLPVGGGAPALPVGTSGASASALWTTLTAGIGSDDSDVRLFNEYPSLVTLLRTAPGTDTATAAAALNTRFEQTVGPLVIAGKLAATNDMGAFNAAVKQALAIPSTEPVPVEQRVAIWANLARVLDGSMPVKSISPATIRTWVANAAKSRPAPGTVIAAQAGAPEIDAFMLETLSQQAANNPAINNRIVCTRLVASPAAFHNLDPAVTGVFPSNPIRPGLPITDRAMFKAARDKAPARGSMESSLFAFKLAKFTTTAAHLGYETAATNSTEPQLDVVRDAYGTAVSAGPSRALYASESREGTMRGHSKNMLGRWEDVSREGINEHGLIRAASLFFLLSAVNMHQMLRWADSDIYPGVDFLIMRPFKRYSMHSMCLVVPGPELGQTALNHIDAEQSVDTVVKEQKIHVTAYSKAFIRNAAYVARIEDIYSSSYIGGEGVTFHAPGMVDSDPTVYRADAFCVMIPAGSGNPTGEHPYRISSGSIDITGVFPRNRIEPFMASDAASRVDWKRPTYPSAHYTRAVYNFHMIDGNNNDNSNPLDETEKYSEDVVRRNRVCHMATHYQRDAMTREFTIERQGVDHWGHPCTFNGAKPYRTGVFPHFNERTVTVACKA
jgi:hypothetical protein